MKRILIISLICAASQGMSAGMTLNDCLVYARDHAHANVLGALGVEKAEADRRIAISGVMPDVSFTSGGNISFGRNIDPETNTYDNKKTLSSSFGLQMSLPLFDGLVSLNNIKAARVARLRMEKQAQIEQDRISLEVIRAFYNVSYCKAMVSQMQSQLSRDSTDLAATERGERLGTKSGADVAEMKALVAADEFELTNQRNLLAKAYLALRGLMGMPISEEPLDLEEDTTEEIVADKSTNPRIAEAQLAVDESRYNLRMAKGSLSPRLSLSGGISTSFYKMIGDKVAAPSFSSQWHDNMGEYIGVSLVIPLFNGLSSVNKVKRAKIEMKESLTRLEQTRYEIEKETREAELDLRAATDELRAATRRLDAEQLAFTAVRRKYELGNASAIELYTSSAKLAAARASLEGKRIQRIISSITLGYYRGEKLIKE